MSKREKVRKPIKRARLKGRRRYAAKPLSAHPFRRRRLVLGGAKMRRLRHAKIPDTDRFGGDCFNIDNETPLRRIDF